MAAASTITQDTAGSELPAAPAMGPGETRLCSACLQTPAGGCHVFLLGCDHLCCVPCARAQSRGDDEAWGCPTCGATVTTNRPPVAYDVPAVRREFEAFLAVVYDDTPLALPCRGCKAEGVTHYSLKARHSGPVCARCAERHLADGHRVSRYRQYEVCARHGFAVIRGWCVECEERLCDTCLMGRHLEHDTVDMENQWLVGEKRTALTAYSGLLQGALLSLHNALLRQAQAHTDSDTGYGCAEQLLEALRDGCGRAVGDALAEVGAMRRAQDRKYEAWRAEVERLRETWQRVTVFVEDESLAADDPCNICWGADHLPDLEAQYTPLPPDHVIPLYHLPVPVPEASSPLIYVNVHAATLRALSPNTVSMMVDDTVSSTKRSSTGVQSAAKYTALEAESRGPRGGGRTRRRTALLKRPEDCQWLVWEACVGTGLQDIVPVQPGEAGTGGWWVKTDHGVYRLDEEGHPRGRVANPAVVTHGRMCMDGSGRPVVVAGGGCHLACVGERGEVTREIPLPVASKDGVQDLAYCSHAHRFIFITPRRLVLLDAATGAVTVTGGMTGGDTGREAWDHGAEGEGHEDLFTLAWYVSHTPPGSDRCVTYVSDSSGICVKEFDGDGLLVRVLGAEGGPAPLSEACGVCAEEGDSVLVCDRYQVRRYRWLEVRGAEREEGAKLDHIEEGEELDKMKRGEQGEQDEQAEKEKKAEQEEQDEQEEKEEQGDEGEKVEVVIAGGELTGCAPLCVSMSRDMKYLVVGMEDPDGLIRCYCVA